MLIHLLGKNLDDIRPLLARYGWREAAGSEQAELVVAHGGDGTLLSAEWHYPEIPKLVLRDTRTAPLCPEHSHEQTLADFAAGRLQLRYLPMIDGIFEDKRVTGINDVFVHNMQRGNALRYRVWIDDELYAQVVLGDAVGLATVHGSTAYYRSITHSLFRVGLGLAFSNSTEVVNHLVLDTRSVVRVRILRGPGLLMADNGPCAIEIPADGEVLFRLSERRAAIYALDRFMCPACRSLRHPKPMD